MVLGGTLGGWGTKFTMVLALTLTYHQCTTAGIGGVGYKVHYGVGSYTDNVPLLALGG